MKITELVKQLNSLKRKHGDLLVSFDASSLTEDELDEEVCVRPISIYGVFKVRYDSLVRGRKEVLLIDQNSASNAFEDEERL